MNIYPALDLLDGNCVRLRKGDFDQKTTYSNDPLTLIRSFEEAGAQFLHLVDLSGARDPSQRQTKVIRELVSESKLKIQCGGGIRTREDVAILLDCGVERVVIGSITVSNRALVKSILHEFGPNRITLAIDVVRVKQEFFVAVNGWKNVTDTRAIDLVREYRELVERVLCTDIQLDGMMMGPNVQLYENFLRDFPELDFQASGGMSRLEDLDKLSAVGIRSAVVGKAIYEGTLDLCEALSRFRGGVRAY